MTPTFCNYGHVFGQIIDRVYLFEDGNVRPVIKIPDFDVTKPEDACFNIGTF